MSRLLAHRVQTLVICVGAPSLHLVCDALECLLELVHHLPFSFAIDFKLHFTLAVLEHSEGVQVRNVGRMVFLRDDPGLHTVVDQIVNRHPIPQVDGLLDSHDSQDL